MGTLEFSEAPVEEWKDEEGAQAIFTVRGSSPMLGNYIMSLFPLEGLNTQWEWEVLISDNRPDQMMVVCSADIPDSEFKQGLAVIAARCSCIDVEEFERYKQHRIRAAMAVSGDDTFAWSGSVGNGG